MKKNIIFISIIVIVCVLLFIFVKPYVETQVLGWEGNYKSQEEKNEDKQKMISFVNSYAKAHNYKFEKTDLVGNEYVIFLDSKWKIKIYLDQSDDTEYMEVTLFCEDVESTYYSSTYLKEIVKIMNEFSFKKIPEEDMVLFMADYQGYHDKSGEIFESKRGGGVIFSFCRYGHVDIDDNIYKVTAEISVDAWVK